MKTFYKLHIHNSAPIDDYELELMRPYFYDYTDRLVVNEEDAQIASIILSSDDSGNPDLDEVSIFIGCADEWGNAGVYFGFPKEDGSNAVDSESTKEVWNLLDNCIIK